MKIVYIKYFFRILQFHGIHFIMKEFKFIGLFSGKLLLIFSKIISFNFLKY